MVSEIDIDYASVCSRCGNGNISVLYSGHREGVVGVLCRECGYRDDNPDVQKIE